MSFINFYSMGSQHSMDIVVQFDLQELKNALDQAVREATNRYDLKDSNVKIELKEDNLIVLEAASDMQVEALNGILIKKIVGRGLSHKILQPGTITDCAGMRKKMEVKVTKVLDKENAKIISGIIRNGFPKAKPSIQGETVRVSSQSIDDLQAIISVLRADESIKVPLHFENYR